MAKNRELKRSEALEKLRAESWQEKKYGTCLLLARQDKVILVKHRLYNKYVPSIFFAPCRWHNN